MSVIMETRATPKTMGIPILCLAVLIQLSYLWWAPAIILGDASLDTATAGAESGGGTVARQILYLMLFTMVVYQVIMRSDWSGIWQIPWPVALLLAWCWLSVAWSVDPTIAVRRLVFLTIVSLSVIYLTQMLETNQVIQIIVASCLIILSLDWIAVALFPMAIHTMENEALDEGIIGNWRGLHNHKNEAGPFCAITCLLLLHETWRLRSRIIGPIAILAASVFLWKSVSKTSIGFMIPSLLIGVVAHYAYKAPRARFFGLIGVAIVFLGATAFYGNRFISDYVKPTLADPTSFTGRGQIWQIVFDYAANHLWFGAGYGSFWGTGTNSPVLDYAADWITDHVESSHDGYLNLLATIGLPGLILAVAVLIVYPLYLGLFAPLDDKTPRSLMLSIIIFISLHDFLESSILEPSEPPWIMMLIMYSLLEKAKPERLRTMALRINELS